MQTVFHKTKCDLQKWFFAITLTLIANREISSRQLARDIEVSKDAAWFILHRIRKTSIDDPVLLDNIIEDNKVYLNGKNKASVNLENKSRQGCGDVRLHHGECE